MQKQLGHLVDLQKIESAVANLDDATLEDLANRSHIANEQLQAGITNTSIIAIAVLAATGVVVLIVIWARVNSQ